MSRKKTARKDQPVKKGKAEITPKKTLREPNQFFLIAVLIIATIFVYATSLNNGWTNWDDEGYVLNNELVKSISIKEILSTYVMGNYHPVTVLAQAIEYHFFQEDASGFHTISLLLHLANALLVFFAILLLTKKSLAAFLCALLFAIHPLHVESVSWISAQKDLLYTGFYFAAIIFYLKFILNGRKKISFFLLSLLSFILSNLSKGQAVTLPVILLLIDFYLERKITPKGIVEKLPFFLISVVFGIIAVLAQKQSESIQELEDHSFIIQILFAAFSFINYIIKLFLPLNLSADYPYPEKTGGTYPFYIYTAPVMIFIIGYLCIRFRKKIFPRSGPVSRGQREDQALAEPQGPDLYSSCFFGAAFFTVNILLVLQLLPVGGAMMADRYTYLSSVGIFFPLGIFVNDVWEKRISSVNNFRTFILAGVIIWILFLGIQARSRTAIWKNGETLWSNVIKMYPRLPIAQNNLGSYYQKQNQLELAKPHFDEAIRLQPEFVNALINRCDYFRTYNQIDSALIDGNHAVKLEPENPEARVNRGIAFSIAGKLDSAMMDFKIAASKKPGNAQVLNNLGNLYSIKAKYDSALVYYNAALKADPAFLDVLNNRGKCNVFLGNYDQAVTDLTQAIEINPGNANNYYFRMQAYEKLGRKKEALADAQKAISLGMKISEEELGRLK